MTNALIEILPVELLDRHRAQVNELRALARTLKLDFGWHYLLDLVWILDKIGPLHGRRIVDAGAGTGILQWYLAEKGAEVISVDRMSRADLPLRFRVRYQVRGLRSTDLRPAVASFMGAAGQSVAGWRKLRRQAHELSALRPRRRKGSIAIYNQDLRDLADIPSESIDAVVAVSALEHNPPENLPVVVAELMRVLKPEGRLAGTLGAAKDQDWFHQPSQGWCYTETSLKRLFSLPADTPSNYAEHDALLAGLRECTELRKNLARFYSQSGDNGMPWGKWDPQYQPVGVLKTKL